MPEGPEIRIAADKIAAVLVNRVTTDVKFSFAHLRKYQKYLTGQRVLGVDTRGKAILVRFENDWAIYSHNQLYGRRVVDSRGQPPATNRQLRLAIHNRAGSAFLFSASAIEVMRADALRRHPFLSKLGPDILNAGLDAKLIVSRLNAEQFRNRRLAGLLLDQGFLAGLGNYLRAEILTLARLHPLRKPSQCSPAELLKLAQQIIRITRRSYRTHGITNPPRIVAKLKSAGKESRAEFRFNTYGRKDEPCYYCGNKIECINAGGRKMYYCPGCQPAL